ncbi:cell wall hydrolase [Sphingomonas sp. Leaf21]|jgi:hypothetical protein|uniref:cell wall hydrolase n=1 Tax=Sphingomonas sp. Leaf21 TaxID=2876550 RepID=UPI001E554A44|nr:cell wall hydrolase [Sphingomonas sp. Leaf21]
MVQVWLILLGLMLTVGLMLAAQAAWRARPPRTAATAPGPFGAAKPVPVDVLPAMDGSTGTVALPTLPIPPGARLTDNGMTAARPFAWGPADASDRARAMECLTAAIYYEANGESIDGQRAVAQVVLNRARHPAFPATICGVVYQGVERAHCQFSFACDGALSHGPSVAGWSRAARIAAAALSGSVFTPVGLATHYHTFAVAPAWNRAMVMTDMVGAHLFHRWKGYWGTAAAMNRVYRGGEAMPALPALSSVAAGDVPAAAAFAVPPTPIAAAMAASPSLSRDPASPPPAAAPVTPVLSERLSRSGDILDKWKDSGRMIERPEGSRQATPGATPVADQRR